jgi:hypothetical protein
MTNNSAHPDITTWVGPIAVAVLESLYQHRLLSTRQIHALHLADRTPRNARRVLAGLRSAGLAGSVRLPRRVALWHLTDRGIRAVETIPSRVEIRRKIISADYAAGPLQQHTLDVNDVGIAFVQAARTHGDECGPFAWRHEIAHPLPPTPGQRREQLIADAVLTYQQNEPDKTTFHYRFIELDRATRANNDLARRLARYARLYRHTTKTDKSVPTPAWADLYPVFPEVLVALAGKRSDALQRRRRTVLELCQHEPDLRNAPHVRISMCLLDDLKGHGPFSPIFYSPHDPHQPTDWVGAADQKGSR